MTQYEIGKWFKFAAAHRLTHLSPDHQCYRPHGHNYEVQVVLRSPLLATDPNTGPRWWIADYGDLSDTFGRWVKDNLDHRDLNEVVPQLGDGEPTAEVLAFLLFDLIAHSDWPWRIHLQRVVVKETPTSYAAYGAQA